MIGTSTTGTAPLPTPPVTPGQTTRAPSPQSGHPAGETPGATLPAPTFRAGEGNARLHALMQLLAATASTEEDDNEEYMSPTDAGKEIGRMENMARRMKNTGGANAPTSAERQEFVETAKDFLENFAYMPEASEDDATNKNRFMSFMLDHGELIEPDPDTRAALIESALKANLAQIEGSSAPPSLDTEDPETPTTQPEAPAPTAPTAPTGQTTPTTPATSVTPTPSRQETQPEPVTPVTVTPGEVTADGTTEVTPVQERESSQDTTPADSRPSPTASASTSLSSTSKTSRRVTFGPGHRPDDERDATPLAPPSPKPSASYDIGSVFFTSNDDIGASRSEPLASTSTPPTTTPVLAGSSTGGPAVLTESPAPITPPMMSPTLVQATSAEVREPGPVQVTPAPEYFSRQLTAATLPSYHSPRSLLGDEASSPRPGSPAPIADGGSDSALGLALESDDAPMLYLDQLDAEPGSIARPLPDVPSEPEARSDDPVPPATEAARKGKGKMHLPRWRSSGADSGTGSSWQVDLRNGVRNIVKRIPGVSLSTPAPVPEPEPQQPATSFTSEPFDIRTLALLQSADRRIAMNASATSASQSRQNGDVASQIHAGSDAASLSSTQAVDNHGSSAGSAGTPAN